MRINFDLQFLDLKGNPLHEKMDDVLAAQLAMSNIGDPQKMHKLAVDLVNTGEIELNEEDYKFLRKFIRDLSRLNNLAKAQLLEQMEIAEAEENQNDFLPDKAYTKIELTEEIGRNIMRDVNNVR